MNTAVYIILIMAAVYLLAGSLFAIFFLSKGIEKIDVTAHGSGWGFRCIIIPGTIVFWPVLLKKWISIKKIGHDKAAS
jgi:hypothetical protein